VASSRLAECEPPMWGMATLAMEVSSASMKVARVTVTAMSQGLARGLHVSWNEAVTAAKGGPFLWGWGSLDCRLMVMTLSTE